MRSLILPLRIVISPVAIMLPTMMPNLWTYCQPTSGNIVQERLTRLEVLQRLVRHHFARRRRFGTDSARKLGPTKMRINVSVYIDDNRC